MELIESSQEKFDKLDVNVNYERDVFPILRPIINMLQETKNFPTTNRYSVYVDSLMLILYHEYANDAPKDIFNYKLSVSTIVPIHAIVYVLIDHPIFIDIINQNLTIEEWIVYRKKLLDSLLTSFGDVTTNQKITALKNRLMNNINESSSSIINESSAKNISSVHLFRYLIGFSFREEEVGELTGNVLFVNLGYNNNNKDSVIYYKPIPSIRRRLFLDIKTIDNLKPFININVQSTTSHFRLVNRGSDKTTVVLDYNDDKHYVKAYFDGTEDGTISSKFVDRFINGATPLTLKAKDIDVYIKSNLFERFKEEPVDAGELIRDYNLLLKVANDSFSFDVRTFIDNIMKNPDLKKVISSSEMGVFKTYLHGIRNLLLYDKNNVLKFICSYLSEEAPVYEH